MCAKTLIEAICTCVCFVCGAGIFVIIMIASYQKHEAKRKRRDEYNRRVESESNTAK